MTITDEMIEAAARAICFSAVNMGDPARVTETIVDVEWREYAAVARAALTAVAPLIARRVRAKTVEEWVQAFDGLRSATQDMVSTGICAVFDDLEAAIREAGKDRT